MTLNGTMKTKLLTATDLVGGVEWTLPAQIEKFITELPEPKRTMFREQMGLMLSACAHAICAEVEYSIRTDKPPMRDMMAMVTALLALQSARLNEPSVTEPPPTQKGN